LSPPSFAGAFAVGARSLPGFADIKRAGFVSPEEQATWEILWRPLEAAIDRIE
jgi:hypothetical protein